MGKGSVYKRIGYFGISISVLTPTLDVDILTSPYNVVGFDDKLYAECQTVINTSNVRDKHILAL